ncbi:MAG: CapA family protein [Chloroflexi bacterium]|nr:CapA family protein [Chloroflexota bacterium]
MVLGFALLFAIGAIGFLATVLNHNEKVAAPSPFPTATATVTAPVGAVLGGPTPDEQLQQASGAPDLAASPLPSVAPAVSPLPSVARAVSPLPTACPDVPLASPPASPAASALPAPSVLPGASESLAPTASLALVPSCLPTLATSVRRMPFVPVSRYWESTESISTADLKQALRGRSAAWSRVMISAGDRDAIAAALDITIDDTVRDGSPEAVIAAVKQGKTLGLLRASDVEPSVRALAIDGRDLFGNDRVTRVGRWPLVADVETTDEGAWDQDATWTLVAGGDSFTDRGVYERVVNRKKGVDYPFDGGTARVTGHVICRACPRANGNSIARYVLSGPRGVFRALVKDADLAITNHEQPTPTNWVFHKQGTRFSGKPELTEIFTRAGIDWMSLANNHIHDFGDSGVLNTLKTLDMYGIKHGGAGKNLKQAAKPSYLKVKGQTVAIVSCTSVSVLYVSATESSAGALPCNSKEAFAAIKAARKKADIVIVFPHWGWEYTRARMDSQERLAARWARMGVDLVLGAHSHIPGGIGDIDGTPVFYSLGNFIFDQNWSTETAEAVLVEMTWHGDTLVQARLHPFLTVDQAQPNLLDPARDDGAALIKAIRNASSGINDW